MIVERTSEKLATKGFNCLELNDYVSLAETIDKTWEDDYLHSFNNTLPIALDNDANVVYAGKTRNISEYAFSQLCSKAGIPAAYIRKCFDTGRSDLAIANYRAWAHEESSSSRKNITVKSYNNTVRAILSDSYNAFPHGEIMNLLADAVTSSEYRNRYTLNQAFINEDRLHLRFVDFNDPVHSDDGSKFYSGFTVSSSSVGAGSFNVKYFLYRFACKNGLVIVKNGGVIYSQTHLSEFEEIRNNGIAASLKTIDELNGIAVDALISSEKKMLSGTDMDNLLDKARKELHMGRKDSKEMQGLQSILEFAYPQKNVISIAHAITEHAQQYDSLDRRLEHETWAGNLLMAA